MPSQEVLHVLHGIAALRELGFTGEGQRIGMLDAGATDTQLDPWIDERLSVYGGTPENGNDHGARMAVGILDGAPAARLVVVDVSKSSGLVYRSGIANGARLLAERPDVRVINVSLEILRVAAYCSPEALCVSCLAMNDLESAGRIVVIAAGNKGAQGITCPAAGGHGIRVTASVGPRDRDQQGDGETGTSIAAAQVTAGCALIVQAVPDVSPAELRDALAATATPLGADPPARGGTAHYFRAYRALQHIRAGGVCDESAAQGLVDDNRTVIESALTGRGESQPALEVIAQALTFAPWSAGLRTARARLWERDSAAEALLELIEALRLEWTISETHRALGRVLTSLGQPGQEVEEQIAAELDRHEDVAAVRVLLSAKSAQGSAGPGVASTAGVAGGGNS